MVRESHFTCSMTIRWVDGISLFFKICVCIFLPYIKRTFQFCRHNRLGAVCKVHSEGGPWNVEEPLMTILVGHLLVQQTCSNPQNDRWIVISHLPRYYVVALGFTTLGKLNWSRWKVKIWVPINQNRPIDLHNRFVRLNNENHKYYMVIAKPSYLFMYSHNRNMLKYDLVGGFKHFLFFHSVGNVIIPIDELIFFRGVETYHQRVIDSYSIQSYILW